MRNKLLFIVLVTNLIMVNVVSPIFGDTFHSSITIRPDEELKPRKEGETITIDENGISKLTYKELDDCTTTVTLTPYASKDSATEEIRLNLEAAHDSILSVTTYDELTSEVATEARKKGVTVNDLVVRDIFDITKEYTGPHHSDPYHDVHGIEDIIIKTKTLKRFVCLLHYKNGVWHVVPDVEILDDTTLRVSVASLSPFAIILANKDLNPVSPIEESTSEEVIVTPVIDNPEYEEPTVEPTEPIEPVIPVEPIEPIEPHKGCCIYHILIILTMIITIIIGLFVRVKKQDDDMSKEEIEDLIKRNKKIKNVRYLIMVINFVLCFIFFILGSCHLDIIALAIDILMLIFFFMFTNRDSDNEQK